MEFRILGPLEVRADGVALALGGTKQRALLAVLLLCANEVVPTDELTNALWEKPPGNATKAVQVYVSRLRKSLQAEAPTSRPPGYVLELEPEQLDLARFQRLVEEARRNPSGAAALLGEALDLWRGPALAEFAHEPFARGERIRLEELRLQAIEERVDADLALGRHARLVSELEALVAAHPFRERLRRLLMVALYRSRRQAEALEAYREGRRILVEELGIEPGRELQELEQAILRHDPSLDLAAESPQAAPAPAPEPPPTADPSAPLADGREERKVVSVLFVDLVGFTSRADLADPEDVRAALQPFHAAAKREIERYAGTVEKFIGDAVMAVFGAPLAHEDDAERAVRAALAIRGWITEEGRDLQVRMAVNTGVAIVSLNSRPERGEPIAAGDVVNTAQRLQTAASANGILVGEQTYRATREAIEYREASPVEAKGKSEPIRVWEVLDARSRFGVDLLREPRTPLVGRRRELDLLSSTLSRVREERSAQLVTLVGVPGIGKSRLVFELFKVVEQEPELITWRQGRSLPYGEGVSFWALGEVVKAQAGILESDSPEQAERKLERAVDDILVDPAEVRWVVGELQPLIGLVGEAAPRDRSGDASAAWRLFIEALADLRPFVLVLEDLHWADEGLLDFVEELVDRVRDAPLFVLCTARPELFERRPSWGGGKANALTISVPPLPEDETARIVAATLEPYRVASSLSAEALSRSGGNPLYAEQFARMLTEVGELGELPESVHGIIAARLDSLAPDEKALLQDGAVVGNVFWMGALEAIAARPKVQVGELLFGLERKEFLQRAPRASVAGESEYAFRHVLLRDVAYGQIPRAARAEKHRGAAAWIENLGRGEDHAEMLAHHYLRALEYEQAAGREDPELSERARLALRGAGDRALALASFAAAARFYDDALRLWPDDDADHVWLQIAAGRARYGADGTGITLLEQGLKELLSRGDTDGAAEVAVEIARCFWEGGDRDAAYAFVNRALELAEGRAGSKARAHGLVARAVYHMLASEHIQAIALAREALPLTESLGIPELRIRALDVIGASRCYLGDVEGIDDSREAIALARENHAFAQLLPAEINLYDNEFTLGHVAAAMEALRTFRHDGEMYGTAKVRLWVRTAEAYEALLYGRWGAATDILERLVDEAESGADHYLEPTYRVLRASIEFARGDVVGAAEGSEKALARARRTKDPQLLAPALALRSMVLLAEGRREEAYSLAAEVLALDRPVVTFLELFPAVTPIEFAWLLRDMGCQQELRAVLQSAPSIPWIEAARAIANGELLEVLEIVNKLELPVVESYTRLRAAEVFAQAGERGKASKVVGPAIDFFRGVGATRYVARAEALLVL
jgi:class 3 adenylate cyclase/DNA-binding SARP family transcriptional activator